MRGCRVKEVREWVGSGWGVREMVKGGEKMDDCKREVCSHTTFPD